MQEQRRAVMCIANGLVRDRGYGRSYAMKTAWSIVKTNRIRIVKVA